MPVLERANDGVVRAAVFLGADFSAKTQQSIKAEGSQSSNA